MKCLGISCPVDGNSHTLRQEPVFGRDEPLDRLPCARDRPFDFRLACARLTRALSMMEQLEAWRRVSRATQPLERPSTSGSPSLALRSGCMEAT